MDIKEVNKLGKVYLAGGWFDDEQMERLEAVKKIIIDAGYDIFSPKDEALCDPNSDLDWRKTVFEGNVEAITNCSFMVNITDKKDMGTIFEAGTAYAKGKPILYFAETLGDREFNLMLAQSGIAVATSREQLIVVLNHSKFRDCVASNTTYADYNGKVE